MRKKAAAWVRSLTLIVVLATANNVFAQNSNSSFWSNFNFFGKKIDEKLLSNLAARGIAYEQIEEDNSGVIKFIGATLDVGQAKPVVLNNFTVVKAQNGYDVSFEQLEFTFGDDSTKLILPLVEIKDWEFADKIDVTANGLSTPAYLAPLFHDKAASIRLKDAHGDSRFHFSLSEAVAADFAGVFSTGEIMLEGVDGGKITSYHDRDVELTLNMKPNNAEEGSEFTAKIARIHVQDYNLARMLEFIFLDAEDPNAPFEQIYSKMEIEDYQVSQSDLVTTELVTTAYAKMGGAAFHMRGAEKAPARFTQEFPDFLRVFTSSELEKEGEERILTTIKDIASLFKMLDEYKFFAEGFSQIQNHPPLLGQVKVNAARIDLHLKEASLDFSYHDMTIDTDFVNVSIGAIELEDFAHIRLIEEIEQMFRTVIKQRYEEGERTFKEKADEVDMAILRGIPHFSKFSIENFHLKGADNSPFKEAIGEWSFANIGLKNDYEFDAAIIPTSFAFDLKDLSIPAHIYKRMEGVEPEINAITSCVLAEKEFFTFSMTLRSEWDRQTQSLRIPNNSYQSNVTGVMGMDVQLGNVPERFFSFNPRMNEEEFKQISLQNLKLNYDPEGADEAFFNCAAKEMKMTAQTVRSLAVFLLQMAVDPDENIERVVKPLRENLIGFVENGGKLELSVKAKDAVGVMFEKFNPRSLDNPLDLFEVELLHKQ